MDVNIEKRIYSIDEIIYLCFPVFEKNLFVEKVFLFGSYAKNHPTQHSDIDFCVVPNDKMQGLDLYGLYPELQDVLLKRVDVLTDFEVKRIMGNKIDKDKVLIYEREH